MIEFECAQDREQELQCKQQELAAITRQLKNANASLAQAEAQVAKLRGENLSDSTDKELETIRAAQERGLKRVDDEMERRDVENFVASENPAFVCPVSHALMKDPVLARDGYSYERASIERWIQEYSGDVLRSPSTNLPLTSADLLPVHTIKSAISEAVDRELLKRRRAREEAQNEGGSDAKRPKVATDT